ncbi:hypothetical protein IV494_08125 [Kaistella sp. G5-32]|uniref:Uncharacterized protein n=1 Tax=Kaistella gelatinilytica TaxID=2787636 RepID=A0ABS0FBR3_9FLAO|nr:hypothetical protein [Kaistella gelatinilytica]MBF8457149.1 hypothetical protein [Kaistella gelatinilytica]
MKLHAVIRESVDLKKGDIPQSIIVEFVGDKQKQHFEIFCHQFDPYYHKIRKWDTWELNIRWDSEIFIDPKTQVKSYFTHLICTEAVPVFQM